MKGIKFYQLLKENYLTIINTFDKLWYEWLNTFLINNQDHCFSGFLSQSLNLLEYQQPTKKEKDKISPNQSAFYKVKTHKIVTWRCKHYVWILQKYLSKLCEHSVPYHHHPLLIAKEEAQYKDESQGQAQQPLLKHLKRVHWRHLDK